MRQPGADDDDLHRSAVVVVNDTPIAANVARRLTSSSWRRRPAGGRRVPLTWEGEVALRRGGLGSPVDRTSGEPARIGVLLGTRV